MKRFSLILLAFISFVLCYAQNTSDFDSFRESILSGFENERQDIYHRYNSYRDRINKDYIEFLRKAWGNYYSLAPITQPKEDNPIPPRPYVKPINESPISVVPDILPIVPPKPQPEPIEPIKGNPKPTDNEFNFTFYGLNESVRLPMFANLRINANNIDNIADAWNTLCVDNIDNTIYDVLELRDNYNLCDWSYLLLLDAITSQFCQDKNGATLLMAFLYCQSGYQMRLAIDNDRLYMLFGSQHQIFDKGYFVVDGITFYPYGEPSNSIKICAAPFEGETPLSLLISAEQNLGAIQSDTRNISSQRYVDVKSISSVPKNLIKFYNSYPTSAIDGSAMTRWAMYANTPLAQSTKNVLYPRLKLSIENCSKLEAANKLLNWVQTGFEYEYDDKVWGHDRAFFAEETLYYPYADCEDRSILFSRLVRDLLGLDVALIYYPGHLATAIKFETEVRGDAILINGDRYVVCDPTYIDAPVGAQMPGLEYDNVEAILLKK